MMSLFLWTTAENKPHAFFHKNRAVLYIEYDYAESVTCMESLNMGAAGSKLTCTSSPEGTKFFSGCTSQHLYMQSTPMLKLNNMTGCLLMLLMRR